ncbi:MAG: hypothetical protein FJX71_06360 [Alphaproteobacteria bacterium]|nr:hypothetical protein [Alphaproteobacteria bacterium]
MEEPRQTTRIVQFSSPFHYRGNVFYLILFLILWLPVGVLLLIKNSAFVTGTAQYYISYHAQWNWLLFWGVVFFPVAIFLLIIKGISVIGEVTVAEEMKAPHKPSPKKS